MSKRIYLLTPAKNGQGGISRIMKGYFDYCNDMPDYRLILFETRGEKAFWYPYFIYNLMRYFLHAWLGYVDLLEINVASYGSTYRKYLFFRISHFFHIPCILRLHSGGFESFYDSSSEGWKKRIQYMFKNVSKVIILGNCWKPFVVDSMGVAEKNILVLPNAVPDPHITRVG